MDNPTYSFRETNFSLNELRFFKFKKFRLLISFWGTLTHSNIIEFSNFLLQLKNQRSESKTVCGFPSIFILKGIMMF